MSILMKSIYAPTSYCISRPGPDEKSIEVICVNQNMQVYSIDGVCANIWRGLDGKTSVRQILDAILADFDVPATRAKKDLHSFLNQLLSMELIEER